MNFPPVEDSYLIICNEMHFALKLTWTCSSVNDVADFLDFATVATSPEV